MKVEISSLEPFEKTNSVNLSDSFQDKNVYVSCKFQFIEETFESSSKETSESSLKETLSPVQKKP